jgi:hypothetical protein
VGELRLGGLPFCDGVLAYIFDLTRKIINRATINPCVSNTVNKSDDIISEERGTTQSDNANHKGTRLLVI